MVEKVNHMLRDAEEYVSSLFRENFTENLLYHNMDHVRSVVARINEIAAHYDLSEEDTLALNLAGWFHDTGHIFANPSEHEEKSAEIAADWLSGKPGMEDIIPTVKNLILATRINQSPTDIREEIIKDADTYHFGTKEFKKTDKLLRREMELRNMTTLVMDWERNTYVLIRNHQFYTDYCRQLLTKRKGKNERKLQKKASVSPGGNTPHSILLNENGENAKQAAKQNSFVTKGIQTMLRISSENHMRLSDMADSKANILISVNAIIISVILSVLIRKIEVETHLAAPTFIFLAFSVATIVLAILATRPKITKGNFSRQEVLERKTNLLFFGNFYKTDLEEYKWGMSTMMRDPNYIYGGLIDDIYYLGKVLGAKYKMLSIAYLLFMAGIVISVIAFVLAIVLHQPDNTPTIVNGSGSPF